MGVQKTIRGRYEIKAVIGQGGMGVVYRAYDPVMKREVAIKTLHDVSSQPVLDLFYRECSILKGIVHPNVIDILDMGDFEDEGVTKPYYVMPLLPGKTLYDLLHPAKDITEPLTVDRAVEIIVQTSRGLQAAHERELLHRDVKPRNIFVIDEYSVKLIDFGVAHLLGSNSTTGVKGTPEYMSPEQLKMKPLSRRSDIFSLATVCYEILTGHQPFRRPTQGETATAVVNLHPPLACNVNPSVPRTISQVIGKAMAKEPLSRFSTAAEFAEALQRARRNEPLTDLFDPTESLVRLQRARLSFEQGDYQFCSEVLRDLEAEGQTDAEIQELRRRVDEALLRQTTARLYEAAERYFRTQEYSLALRKVEEILELDAHHSGATILKRKIEDVQAERKVAELLHAAAERLQQAAFTEARKVLQDAHRLRPDDTRVRQMLAEVDSRQKEFLKQRQELERLYQTSQAAWLSRDISQALLNLERLAELARQTPEPRDRIAEYEDFYKVVRTEHDSLLGALEQARQKLAAGDFAGSLALCGRYLGKYPRHAAFAALKSEVERKQEEQQAAFRIEVDRQLGGEPNLERQIQILEEARGKYPEESYYANQLLRARELQAEVASILDAAQLAEDADDFGEALAQWKRLRSVYPRFPDLEEQVARLTKSQEQAQAAAKNRWDGDLEKALGRGDLEQAASLLVRASAQFPGEFQSFQDRLDQARARKVQARQLLSNARTMALSDRSEGAIEIFRKAYEADPMDGGFRQSVIQAVAEHAQASVDSDWKTAEGYLDCARALDPAFTVPKDVRLRIEERQQAEFIGEVLARAAIFEKQGDPQAALHEIDGGLGRYAGSKPLKQMRARVEAAQAELERKRVRAAALQRAHELVRHVEGNLNLREAEVQRIREEASSLAQRYQEDEELRELAAGITRQSLDLQEARRKVADGDLEGARAIADPYLKRLPHHASFLDVQAQVSERELQLAIEYMDEVNRRLVAESDLDRRVQILEEAQRRYPEEYYYREQLDVVRREQSLVHTIADEAAALENAGQFKEALDQWNRLRAIYRFYPDLATHTARVSQRHEQALGETQARWTAQALQALDNWDYAQAVELIRRAEAEFPGKFRELADKVKQGADLRMGAQTLISEAQDLSGQGRWEESQGKLQGALVLAPGDPVIEKQVLAAYAKSARVAIKTGWKAAQGLLQAASAVDANFVAPADLLTKIEERRRKEFIDQALGQSKQLQDAGDLQAAADAIYQALELYPGDTRLSQKKTDLEGDLRKIEEEQARRRALDELREMEGVTRTMVASPLELDRIVQRAGDIARSHPKDKELYSASGTLREQVEALQNTRTLLDAGKLEEAQSVTDRMLQRFEKHSAFLALKQAIQDARAQKAADYMDEVTRRLGAVQDLGQREALLREAVGKYPAEPYYQQELDFVHEKQRLVTEIVNSARDAEQAGHHEEAIDLWKRLRTVHRDYDGLDAEIERLGAARADRQAAARDELLTEAGQAVEERNFQRASEVLHRIETEIGPSAGEECARLRLRMEAIQSAIRMAAEGGRLFADRMYAEGSKKFLEAARQAPQDRELVDGLAGELVRHAESIANTDWRGAGPVVEALHGLAPKHPALSGLRARIDHTRREEAVARLLKESQAMLDSGDARSAEKAAMGALSSYPGDARLTERLAAIRATLAGQERRLRIEQALKELAALEEEAQAANPRRLKKALKEADGIAARNHSEVEVQQRANAVKQVVSTHIAEKERKRTPEKQGAPAAAGSANTRRRIWLGAGIAAVVALGITFILRPVRSERQIPVTITSDLAGATVSAGGAACVTPNCAVKLPAGRYKLTASKDGYRTVTEDITIAAGQPELKLPAFEPLPQVLQVNTNFESGRVYLDGRDAGELRDGQFSLSGVAPRRHTVRVTSGQVEFQTEWRSSIGESPAVLQPVVAKDVQATVVTSLGETATVTCNCGTSNVTLDGAPAGQAAESSAAATPMKNLKDGTHQLTFAGRSLVVEGRPEPTIRLFLSLDRNAGILVVETGVDGARVYLNDKLYQRTTERGALRIPLDVGQYSIRVEKDGYRLGASQVVGVQKGEQKRVAIPLTPVPAVLEIAGALPGAQVRVDGSAVGLTDANGGVRAEVQPGNHSIELTKDEYTPARFSAPFAAGRTVRPDRMQLAMARVAKPPDPVQVEAQDWERMRTSNNVNNFDDFLLRHPNGAHAGDARERAAQFRQQQQANFARQADQAAWDATDKNRKASVQDYLSRFGNGAHAQEARGLIVGIDKQEADALTVQRAKEQSDKEQIDKEREVASRATAEEQAITRLIGAYEAAYNAKDLKALQSVWSGMPKATVDAIGSTLKNARSITFQLRPLGKPEISGDSATVNCARSLSMTVPGQRIPTADDRVRVRLERMATGWVIRSMNPY